MRLVVISDTHGAHEELGELQGDVLIHCGDFESIFESDPQIVEKVDDWFARQRFGRIYCVGGNHDEELERRVALTDQPFKNAIWLHERRDMFRGYCFYGASWVPYLRDFPFFADADALEAAWARIPGDVDVLMTHTPPKDVLDVSSKGQSLGCPHLAERLKQVAPGLHCFGHVHKSRGETTVGATRYVNATSVSSGFASVLPPFVVDLPDR